MYMSFINKYNYGYSDPFSITGREEITENLNLTINPNVNSGKLQGIVTSGGVGVFGAVVKVFDTLDNPVAHANTAALGQYIIANIPAGSYSAVAIKDGYLLPIATPFTILNNTTTTINIALTADPDANENVIYGIVADQVTGLPILDASVSIYLNTSPTPTLAGIVTSNEAGQYAASKLVAGQYYALVSALGYFPKQTANIDVTTNDYANISVQLATDPASDTGTISGFIRDEDTGLPVDGAMVALYSISGGIETIISVTKSSASGRYLFGNVLPGSYRVKSTLQIAG
jgi:5-hydroxyisourate hydrolase-like protein (transthyretin family)